MTRRLSHLAAFPLLRLPGRGASEAAAADPAGYARGALLPEPSVGRRRRTASPSISISIASRRNTRRALRKTVADGRYEGLRSARPSGRGRVGSRLRAGPGSFIRTGQGHTALPRLRDLQGVPARNAPGIPRRHKQDLITRLVAGEQGLDGVRIHPLRGAPEGYGYRNKVELSWAPPGTRRRGSSRKPVSPGPSRSFLGSSPGWFSGSFPRPVRTRNGSDESCPRACRRSRPESCLGHARTQGSGVT